MSLYKSKFLPIFFSHRDPSNQVHPFHLLKPVYTWLFLVFGEPLKKMDQSATLPQKMMQEVAGNADHAAVPVTGGTGDYLNQRSRRGSHRSRHLCSQDFVLPTLLYPFLGHSQLLPPETTRSALCWPPHSFVSERPQVLLSAA